MRKSLLLPIILLVVLTVISCQTTHILTPLEPPQLGISVPERPKLIDIPIETSAAIKALTLNVNFLRFSHSNIIESRFSRS